MKRFTAHLFAWGGLCSLIYFAVLYLRKSNSITAFGYDIFISEGTLIPVLISGIAFITGMAGLTKIPKK